MAVVVIMALACTVTAQPCCTSPCTATTLTCTGPVASLGNSVNSTRPDVHRIDIEPTWTTTSGPLGPTSTETRYIHPGDTVVFTWTNVARPRIQTPCVGNSPWCPSVSVADARTNFGVTTNQPLDRPLLNIATDLAAPSTWTIAVRFTDDPTANGGSVWTDPTNATVGLLASFSGTAWRVATPISQGWPNVGALGVPLYDFSTYATNCGLSVERPSSATA